MQKKCPLYGERGVKSKRAKLNGMTVQRILSPGKQAMRRACQRGKKTAQRRKGLPARVLRIERQKKSTTKQERKVFCLWQEKFL